MAQPAYADAAEVVGAALARGLAPRKPLTVSQWADAHRRLSSKGSAQPGIWRTDSNPPLREPMDCMSARHPVREVALKFPIQFGKALALDTPIPTPAGWTTMGDIAPGDVVFGDDGQPARVVAASEVFHDHPCYLVRFSDGSEVVADAGHRWQVIDLQRRNEARKELKRRSALDADGGVARRRAPVSDALKAHQMVLTTDDLAARVKCRGQSRYAIEVAKPLELPPAVLPIDPYLLGLWLGDGHSHYGAITTMDAEIVQAFAAFDPKPHTHQSSGRAVTYGLRNGFGLLLRRLGVLKNKHVPLLYLRASREQRLALLQGLMDTDGHAGPRGHVEITSSYPALVDGIVELVCSLGFKPTVVWRGTKGRPSARIAFAAYQGSDVFRLPRKLASLLAAPSQRGADAAGLRYITAIERVATVPTRCIAVDNASHLFLCGRAMIPTHNTEVALNSLGYVMDHNPGPVMVCLPGEVSMSKWVAQKLNPMIEETPVVRESLSSTASRDGANRREFKDFNGGQLYIEHAGSPQRLKSTTVRTLIVDELDEFAQSLHTGDDPVEMLNGRTSAFPGTYKRLYISTPTLKGVSRIGAMWEASDQRRYHVPCPHCGHEQPLEWAGLRWGPRVDGVISGVWYVCGECGAHIEEHHKTAMIQAGRWVPHNPGARRRGYHINALYYQIGLGPRWADLVEMWLDAQGDPAKLKTFVNDRLAEEWEDPAMRAIRHNAIADRAEQYPLRQAPQGVCVVTAGVDTQDNRLAVQLVGWGAGLAFWVLDYVELPGDPADEAVWTALTELLNRPIQRADGVMLRVEAVDIDMGGHRTEAVKAYVRDRRVRRPMASFGAVANTAPVLGKPKAADVTWRGQTDRKGVHTYQVGTVAAKHWLFGRLSTDADKAPEERLTHFSADLPPEYFAGLVSETYNPAKNRFEKRRGARNEPLDTWVYAYAAAHHPELRLHRLTRGDWAAIEARLQRQLGAPAPADGAAAQPAAANANTAALQAPPKAATVFNRPARRPVGPGRTW